jgi:inhibitor of cysteine peptidase
MTRFNRLASRLHCVLAALLAAAGSLAAPASAEDAQPLTVKPGRKFTLTLESNPTTGYSWRLAKPVDEKLITLLTNEFVRPKSDLAGAPGAQVWKFKAVHEGQARIHLEYVRPWETGAQPARQTNFIVTVTSSKPAK